MDDRSEQVLAIAVTFMVVCWMTVGLRVYCRLQVVKSFGPDDFSLVTVQLVFTVYLVSQLLGWQHGTGRHKSALSEADNSQALMFWFICELLYIACTCLLKISAGHFLLRLAVDARHIWALRVLMLSTAAFGTAYFFMVLFQCEPPSVFWEASPRGPGHCWSDGVVLSLTYAASVVNCLADWSFGLMPILVVRTLHMPQRTKVLVGCLMSFASIASIATIVRMLYIPTLLDGDDFLFRTTDVAIWSTVEVGIGVAALSMAALHPLLTHWRRRLGIRHPHSAATGTADSSSLPLSAESRRGKRSRIFLGPLRRNYMRANSQPDLRHHHQREQRQQQQEQQGQQGQQQQQHSPLKLRPEESIMHISSASGPPPGAAPFSRFALASWAEEGGSGGGGDGRGSRSSSRSYHRRSNGSSTTELADWNAAGHSGGNGSGGGITKTTEVSQSQHRLDSLPRMEAVLLSKAPNETSHEAPTTKTTTTTTTADKPPRLALLLPVPSLAAFITSAGHRWSLGGASNRNSRQAAVIGEDGARDKG